MVSMLQNRHPAVTVVSVGVNGVVAKSDEEVLMDVAIDGRRIWSFWLHRDGTRDGRNYFVAWPSSLTSFLDGVARVQVMANGVDEAVFDQEIQFGNGTERIRIVNSNGELLAIDKSGWLTKTFDTRSAAMVQPLMETISAVLGILEDTGVDAFLAYGTLLGAVREGALIGHDSDADLGYLSKFSEPVDVIAESLGLQRLLRNKGFEVRRYSGLAFKVYAVEADGFLRGLDVFGGFMHQGNFVLMGELYEPFKEEWIRPLGKASLEGWEFPVPSDPDKVLTAKYGTGWRVPDPAFKFETGYDVTRRLDGWFRGIRIKQPLWDRVYSRASTPDLVPSSLARLVSQAEPTPAQVVDIGTGRGVDPWWLAEQGIDAVGLDFSPSGYAYMRTYASQTSSRVRYLNFNLHELRHVLGTSAMLAAESSQPRLVMARHVVDAINTRARSHLWRAAQMMTRQSGGRLYLEFLAKSGDDGYARENHVRPISPEMLSTELVLRGARIVSREDLAVTNDPQDERSPSINCRMVVTWEN